MNYWRIFLLGSYPIAKNPILGRDIQQHTSLIINYKEVYFLSFATQFELTPMFLFENKNFELKITIYKFKPCTLSF